jgi:hypothetical protein
LCPLGCCDRRYRSTTHFRGMPARDELRSDTQYERLTRCLFYWIRKVHVGIDESGQASLSSGYFVRSWT